MWSACVATAPTNQLAEIEERSRRGRRVTSFVYDALGRRTEKRSTAWAPAAANDAAAPPAGSSTRVDFVWSGNVLLAEGTSDALDRAPADALATVYLHEPGSFRPLAQIRRPAADAPGALYHYQLDHLGTPQEVTNDDGRVVWQARLKAWGGVARRSVGDLGQPIRFQGQYHDEETGLSYNRFRYFAPDEGCFVQQDPIRLRGGVNLTAYVGNPSGSVDPWGLSECDFNVADSAGGATVNTARLDQISGGYAADEWGTTQLVAGDKVYGGLPGQSPYYTDAATLDAARGSRTDLFQSLQVAPHPEFGYRPMVGEYEVLGDTTVPFGTAQANTNYGAGGGNQFFINDYSTNLRLVRQIPLGQ